MSDSGFAKSLPVRERGLKLLVLWGVAAISESLPVRERGLKPRAKETPPNLSSVAPRAGAWIEATLSQRTSRLAVVAPRAGAWIEAASALSSSTPRKSLPVRERGLKLIIYKVITEKRASRSPCGSVD